ncbi:metal ABC transporter substrate-binding protein, partial [Streptococcus pyogenes]
MKNAGQKTKVIVMSDDLSKGINPHVWLDPVLAMHSVTNILRALQAADPANAQAYASNARAFIEKLSDLDRAFREGLAPARGAPI